MTAAQHTTAGRIRTELTELERVVERVTAIWAQAQDREGDFYVDME